MDQAKKQMADANKNMDIDITKISPQQLVELSKAIEEEIKQLSQSYQGLLAAVRKFTESKGVLNYMKEKGQGKEIMVPLTSSLYVPGVMEDSNKVLIEAGAGYYIEKNSDEAKEYCDRKMKLLQENGNKVAEIIQYKKIQLQKCTNEYQKRLEALQKMQAK